MNIKHYSTITTGYFLWAGMLFYFLAAVTLRADEASSANIGSADSGAYVIYSTPLKGNKSANFLTQDKTQKLSFSKQPGPKLIVIDLGKTYSLGNFHLQYKNPVNVQIYVLAEKPDNGDWTSVLNGKPDFSTGGGDLDANLTGHTGRYIVFFASSDPGPFYGLYITGTYVPGPGGGHFDGGFYYAHNDDFDQTGSGGNGPIGEPPIPRNDYNPTVTNPSP